MHIIYPGIMDNIFFTESAWSYAAFMPLFVVIQVTRLDKKKFIAIVSFFLIIFCFLTLKVLFAIR